MFGDSGPPFAISARGIPAATRSALLQKESPNCARFVSHYTAKLCSLAKLPKNAATGGFRKENLLMSTVLGEHGCFKEF